jgi:hypothetical protein
MRKNNPFSFDFQQQSCSPAPKLKIIIFVQLLELLIIHYQNYEEI